MFAVFYITFEIVVCGVENNMGPKRFKQNNGKTYTVKLKLNGHQNVRYFRTMVQTNKDNNNILHGYFYFYYYVVENCTFVEK